LVRPACRVQDGEKLLTEGVVWSVESGGVW
jgi:hypothetical protein